MLRQEDDAENFSGQEGIHFKKQRLITHNRQSLTEVLWVKSDTYEQCSAL